MVQITSVLALATTAYAATVQVAVGSGGNVFNPSTITANVGDVVQFSFSNSHTVTSSDFGSPCAGTGDSVINSGTLSSGDFSVLVNSTDPIWLYCAYAHHCQQGMTAVINAPSSGDTLDAYTSASKSTSSSSQPAGVQNGILGDASGFSASSASTASGSSGTSAASAVSSDSAAVSTSSGSASGSSTAAAASATKSTSAGEKVQAFGAAGVVGLLALFA